MSNHTHRSKYPDPRVTIHCPKHNKTATYTLYGEGDSEARAIGCQRCFDNLPIFVVESKISTKIDEKVIDSW